MITSESVCPVMSDFEKAVTLSLLTFKFKIE